MLSQASTACIVLFLAGVNLTLFNFIMVQHVAVAFRQIEIAVIMFTLAFFSGISLGYAIERRLARSFVLRALPYLLCVQILLIVLVQPGAFAIAKAIDGSTMSGISAGWIVAYITVFFILFLGGTSVYSHFLPRLVGEGLDLRRAYSWEIAGSLIGLAFIPLLASISHVVLLLAYILCFVVLVILLKASHGVVAAAVLIGAVFVMQFSAWDKTFSAWFYKQWYDGKGIKSVAYTEYTPYHKIEVLRLENDEFMLLLNGQRQFAAGSHLTYSYFVAEYPARLLGAPQTLLLGCGSMSTIGRIGDFIPHAHIVDLDPGVFSVSRRFFQKYNRINELKNWDFEADDAKHYLANANGSFDLIMHDIPPGRTRQTALTYTSEFFTLVKARLTPRGLFSISSLRALGKNSGYGRKMLATLTSVFDHYFVIILDKSAYFYGGGLDMRVPSREEILAAIQHKDKERVEIWLQDDVQKVTQGTKVITIDNTGELIFD